MKRWDLRTLPASTEKQPARAPGPDAPRVPSSGRQNPRVLFSYPECRAVVIDLRAGEELGDHTVRERSILEVVAGRVAIDGSDETLDCAAGTLVNFDPGEHHAVRALEDARLLLVLAPWPAEPDLLEQWADTVQHLPANATVEPH